MAIAKTPHLISTISLFLLPLVGSISFSITQFSPGSSDIAYQGDATLATADVDLNMVTYQYRVGHVTYVKPVRLWDSATGKTTDFSTRFTMTIETTNSTTSGGGLAFFLAPMGFSIPSNSAGGFLGLFNTTTMATGSVTNLKHDDRIVMVEFDTFPNKEWDPDVQHVGINGNSIASSVYAPWDAVSNSGKVATVWIQYNSTSLNLTVYWTYEENPSYNGQVSLFYAIHLKEILPEWVTIGFSAATGALPERHRVSSWDFSSTLEAKKSVGLRWFGRKVIIATVISFVCLVISGFGLHWWVKKRRLQIWLRGGKSRVTHASLTIEKGALPRKFSYHELRAATNRFALDRKLGQGGSGNVYKGTIQGRQVSCSRMQQTISKLS